MFKGVFNRTLGALFSKPPASSPITTMFDKQAVEDAIANNKIVIFSKSYCPYCQKAKSTLKSEFPDLGDQIYIKELDEVSDGAQIQDYLEKRTGQRTVPNIFINKEHIGGSDKLMLIKNEGRLADLVGQ